MDSNPIDSAVNKKETKEDSNNQIAKDPEDFLLFPQSETSTENAEIPATQILTSQQDAPQTKRGEWGEPRNTEEGNQQHESLLANENGTNDDDDDAPDDQAPDIAIAEEAQSSKIKEFPYNSTPRLNNASSNQTDTKRSSPLHSTQDKESSGPDEGVEQPPGESAEMQISSSPSNTAPDQQLDTVPSAADQEFLVPNLMIRASKDTQPPNDDNETSAQSDPNQYSSYNRVSSRLLLVQETTLKPTNCSRGSEAARRVEGFENMKHNLQRLVQAAEVHLETTIELHEAQRCFFACMATFADDTPLSGVVGNAANHGNVTVLNPQQIGMEKHFALIHKYKREILSHARDWQTTVNKQVHGHLQDFFDLERRYFDCNTKTARLRKRVKNADSWNMHNIASLLNPSLQKLEESLSSLVKEHKEKANEICFLLEQVTDHGWNDLFPLVESTMEWEIDRVQHEEEANGDLLPVALKELQSHFQILEEEELNQPRSFHGIAKLPKDLEGTKIEEDGVDGAEIKQENVRDELQQPQIRIDPSKPTLFLDDADPFTARVWIALLEKEVDPLHPTGFHVIPVCNTNAADPGLQLLQSMNQSTSPVLVHNGNIFSDSIRISEYIAKAIRHPLYVSIPSLLPSNPIDTFNMKTFLKRHARISDVFYNLMDGVDDIARPKLAEELFELLGLIDKDLQKFPGPYLCGQQFTLADVSIFPFIEHTNIILTSFGGTSIPESLSALLEWYGVLSRRPSIQMVTADRTVDGRHQFLYPGKPSTGGQKRSDYLIEYHQQRCEFVLCA